MSFFRKNIDAMSAYVPGEQPSPGEKVIKLNTNENPYPPSPLAVKAMQELSSDRLRRYPNPMSREACAAAAKVYGVPEDWVIAGNGSDDLLAMLIRACTGPGRPVVYPDPTYILYRTLAQMQDAEFIEVPFDEDYNLPTDELVSAAGAVTFIARPNSPSGTCCPLAEIETLARNLKGVVVVDEAYADFALDNAMRLTAKYENLIVLRTLSKGYSLAGVRVGFGVAQPALMSGLHKVKDSYNVSSVDCAVAAAAMQDQPYMRACAAKVIASREKLSAALRGVGIKVWPSQSNFVLAQPSRVPAARLYEALKAKAILVRYFKEPRLADKLRISVGTDEENAALVEAIRKIQG
jgi:histidinol-phosphate aminotransferase